MKAIVVDMGKPKDGNWPLTATVRLEPGRFARMFGAKPVLVDLIAEDCDSEGWVRWKSVATRRTFAYMPDGIDIREALERRPVEVPPRATARERYGS